MLLLAPAIAAAALAANPPTLTQSQLVTRANGICIRYAALRAAPPDVTGRLGDPAFDAAWLRLFAREREELGRLVPPPASEEGYARFVATLPPIATSFRRLATALEQGRPVKRWLALYQRFRSTERRAARSARSVGIRRCFGRRDTVARTE